mgnify:CR=1 FL=1
MNHTITLTRVGRASDYEYEKTMQLATAALTVQDSVSFGWEIINE